MAYDIEYKRRAIQHIKHPRRIGSARQMFHSYFAQLFAIFPNQSLGAAPRHQFLKSNPEEKTKTDFEFMTLKRISFRTDAYATLCGKLEKLSITRLVTMSNWDRRRHSSRRSSYCCCMRRLENGTEYTWEALKILSQPERHGCVLYMRLYVCECVFVSIYGNYNLTALKQIKAPKRKLQQQRKEQEQERLWRSLEFFSFYK